METPRNTNLLVLPVVDEPDRRAVAGRALASATMLLIVNEVRSRKSPAAVVKDCRAIEEARMMVD
jgi:hypothetical protein